MVTVVVIGEVLMMVRMLEVGVRVLISSLSVFVVFDERGFGGRSRWIVIFQGDEI